MNQYAIIMVRCVANAIDQMLLMYLDDALITCCVEALWSHVKQLSIVCLITYRRSMHQCRERYESWSTAAMAGKYLREKYPKRYYWHGVRLRASEREKKTSSTRVSRSQLSEESRKQKRKEKNGKGKKRREKKRMFKEEKGKGKGRKRMCTVMVPISDRVHASRNTMCICVFLWAIVWASIYVCVKTKPKSVISSWIVARFMCTWEWVLALFDFCLAF